MSVSLCLADGLLSRIVFDIAPLPPSSRPFTISLAIPEDKSRELRTCDQEFAQQSRERATQVPDEL